jgi:hypothetical protein
MDAKLDKKRAADASWSTQDRLIPCLPYRILSEHVIPLPGLDLVG